MIALDAMRSSISVTIPAAIMQRKDPYCELVAVVTKEMTVHGNCHVRSQRGNAITSIRVECEQLLLDICLTKQFRSSGAAYEIHAPQARIEDNRLDLGSNASWKRHAGIDEADSALYSKRVMESWRGLPVLRKEEFDENGNPTQPGFRLPQLGALHALAAHWTVKAAHAKIVLPTGTGKTDVMIGASMMRPARRTLVIVPSDALRNQISERFSHLGILRKIGAATGEALDPVVGKLLKSPGTVNDISLLRSANIVVSTTNMLLSTENDELKEFLSWFDIVFFDEAHHLPSASWTRISSLVDDRSRVVAVTATPYRNDKRRVPGDLIYQFPLKLAQELGYFTTISVVKIEQIDPGAADVEIARAAVATLRSDEQNHGHRHMIMARARTKEHAETLFRIYQSNYPELDPVLLHSSISVEDRRLALAGIKNIRHRIIVCVDMLGEGVDIPSLKIAALHDSHKSLPVTLQFIGRFTRSSTTAGSATVVINVAEPMADTAVSELFAEDADWNDIIPDLSAKAVGSEEASSAFISTMQAFLNPEDKKFDLGLISAGTNATFYTALHFDPGRVESALSKTSRLHQSWISEDRDLIVFITQDIKYPDWSGSKDAASFDWNLSVMAFDGDTNLLYINSTFGDIRISRLARAVCGENSVRISGERMFRVFDGLNRAVLYNVGLYRKGQVRFQMLAGVDIGSQVSNAIQAGSTKSNLFSIGYDEGKKTNIGASFKGRIWSMTPLSISDWREWCKRVAVKIRDETIATDSFLKFTLIPREVSSKPAIRTFACIPPEQLLPGSHEGERKIFIEGEESIYTQVDLSFENIIELDHNILLEVALGSEPISMLKFSWSPSFRVEHDSGRRLFIAKGSEVVGLEEYLSSNPPALLLQDGSELVGKYHFQYPTNLPYTFSSDSILTLDWAEIPIRCESKWRDGVERQESVQGHMISLLLQQESDFVFDDDDTGEAADIIVLKDRPDLLELEVILYHCKHSSNDAPGARVDDLYVVCGQAVKSCRLMNHPEALLKHMARREKLLRGRPTRFQRGSLGDLHSLLRRLPSYRTRMSVCIVQPGLAASSLNEQLSSILAAADGFVLEFTGQRLKVFGSA